MLNEEVRRIMTKDCVVVSPEDSIKNVTRLMFEKRVQQVPVVDGKVLVGMITAYDMWKHSNAEGHDSDELVKEVMTKKVLVITPKDKVGTAAELFMDRRFSTLPVVNLRHELKGVVKAYDVIRHCLTREYPHPILYSEVFDKTEANG